MKLLLAEDEKALSRALKVILEKNHYTVDAVYDGAEALEYALYQNYDAVILDWMMPKADGITVLRKMRMRGVKTPVLLLTARSEIDDKVTGLDSGANDYLTKPFDAKELLARLRVLTRAGAPAADPGLHVGNTVLDTAGFVLEGPSSRVVLPNKEYQMLEMLLRHPGKYVSADQFMERIWGFDSDTEQSVVWVNISALRKKLISVGSNVVIRMQRGIGYAAEVKE